MKNKKSDDSKQVIVRRYEHYYERRTYGDPWRTIVLAFFLTVVLIRIATIWFHLR